MSERMILNRIKKLKELEEQKKELEKQIADLQQDIKNEMKDAEQLTAGDYIVKWTKVMSNRFDSKSFSNDHKRLYSQYIKAAESRRFSIVG